MEKQSAQITTICECIDHCFAFEIFCEDFASAVDPEDMVFGLDRAVDLVSDATRLQSFLALRRLDEFFGNKKQKPDDLIASELGIDPPSVLAEVGETFLTSDEREKINKGVAHLTERGFLDPDSEVDLQKIMKRSKPAFSRLVTALRKVDARQETVHWLDSTDALIKCENAELNE